jgi:putative membrane protein
MRRVTFIVALAAVAGALAAREPGPGAQDTFDDAMFVQLAASDGMHEVEVGKIASARAKGEEVKQFAQALADDHTRANTDLRAAAREANLPVPDRMIDAHQKAVEYFKNYKGENFDRAFVKHAATAHADAVALYTKASKEAKHKALKEYAARHLPLLEKHLEAARKLDK